MPTTRRKRFSISTFKLRESLTKPSLLSFAALAVNPAGLPVERWAAVTHSG